jgi:hypothetical protein
MLDKIKTLLGIKPKAITLIKYRDPESPDYIYFWVDSKDKQVSPAFSNENDAIIWSSNERSTT